MNKIDVSGREEIAVIGMVCRFPGARDIDAYWQNLQKGVELITFFTEEELLAAGIDPATVRAPNYVKANAILEDIEQFDASFFDYAPREAEITDPQQRIFLECAWEALESAGYATEHYDGRIGVYAGVGVNTYLLNNLLTHPGLLEDVGWLQGMIGNEKDHLTTRVSYKMNLRGPGISISTSCSTSLVAIHLACQSLLNGESDIALAGGVSIKVPQRAGYFYQEGGTSSPDGHCRAFDSNAQGTLAGNGVGVVVLKLLADAQQDGDYIHAVIKGSAINNDGAAKIGYTAPSVSGQAQVIMEAQMMAGVDPASITYIEAHGTGTPLGDPVEIKALTQAFRAGTAKKQFCAVGSVKTNFGHLDIAAGIAGFIKTVLALKHKTLFPSLRLEHPNPQIDFVNSPFYVNTECSSWEVSGDIRRAGVNSLGLGGTNAHVILEEAPPVDFVASSHPYQLLVLAAKTPTAVQAMAGNLAQFLTTSSFELADIAYTLQVGRKQFAYRLSCICHTQDEAIKILEKQAGGEIYPVHASERKPSVIFLFPGQGLQHVAMAQELYQYESVFRECVDQCAVLLWPVLGYDLRELLYPSENKRAEAEQRLHQMDVAQPVLFTIEYALAHLWMNWGVVPDAMIGHSIGEYVAACLSGVLALKDALELIALRGRLMQDLPNGAMLSISLAENTIRPLLDEDVSLAAYNSITDCVVAGTPDAIEKLEHTLREREIMYRHVSIPRAAHSFMLDPILEQFRSDLQKRPLAIPKIPYISNVTGTWITEQQATDPDYWVSHLRQTVRFADGLDNLAFNLETVCLELGPGRTLTTLIRHHLQSKSMPVLIQALPHPRDSGSDLAYALNACGQLWSAGIPILWHKLHAEQRQRVPLPTYPFERQRYWISPGQPLERLESDMAKKADIGAWFTLPSWQRAPLLDRAPSYKAANWLIFIDDVGVGLQMVEQLERENAEVITVFKGKQFRKERERVYTLRPDCRSDYEALLQDLDAARILPTHVVHSWACTTSLPTLEHEDIDLAQANGFYSVLFLVQSLGERGITAPLELILLTNNLQEVIDGEITQPERATILGFHQVIEHEYPNITCRCIDVVFPALPVGYKMLVNQILAECQAGASEKSVAYRGPYRWIKVLSPVQLGESEGRQRLHDQGVYLITGGLGGMGLILAEYLAKTTHAKLVLVSRSGLPGRETWADRLASPDEEPAIVHKIQRIQAMEALGAEVQVLQVDITDGQQVRTMLSRIYERFGTLHGCIHAAGIAGAGMIQLKEPAEAATVLAPKVKGLLNLEAALKGTSLDFIILCSSLSSIVGGPGLLDYCAANAFLDSFAWYNTVRNGIPTVSINWDTWRDVGMAMNASRLQLMSKLSSEAAEDFKGSIEPAEGVEVFRRILSNPVSSQIVVSTRNIEALQQHHQDLQTSVATTSVDSVSPTYHSRPHISTAYVAPRNVVEQQIITTWQKILGLDLIGIYDNFFEIGGDSVMVIQIIRLLHEAFQIALPMHLMFEAPTVESLAEKIIQKQMEDIDDEQMEYLINQVNQLSEEEVLLQLKNLNV